jgi:hypothetical protein
MKYTIQQTFVSLGDSVAQHASTSAQAEQIAEREINLIADMILTNFAEPRDPEDCCRPSGDARESAAWDEAYALVGPGNRLTREAALIVARAAVEITSEGLFPDGWNGHLTTGDLGDLAPDQIPADAPLTAEWTGTIDAESILEVTVSLHSDGDQYYASSSASVRSTAHGRPTMQVILEETGIIERADDPRDALTTVCCCPDPEQRDVDDPNLEAHRLLATTLGELEAVLER